MLKRRSNPFWSQFELLGSPQRPHHDSPPIATSEEVSEAALAQDLDLLMDSNISKTIQRSAFFEDIYWWIARNWNKWLVMAVIYGLGAWALYVLTR